MNSINYHSFVLLLAFFELGDGLTYGYGKHNFQHQLISYRSGQKRPIYGDNVKVSFFNQKLDHFNKSDERTFNQLYWVNDKYHKSNGPAFIHLGGEGPSTEEFIDTIGGMQWLKNAKKFGAIMFQLEHRYYGKSIPVNDYSTKNLKYLSSRQAIEDTTNFIKEMNKFYNLDNVKWIVFGGSYSGSLTAWIRQQYPELVAGAISSSGPILAQVNFQDYLKVVNESFWTYSPLCSDEIGKAFRKVEQMITTKEGKEELKEKFNLCITIPEVPDEKDVAEFFVSLQDTFVTVSQYGGDNKGIYAHNLTIPRTCQVMLDNTNYPDVVDRLATLNNRSLARNKAPCLEFRYSETIKGLKESNPYSGQNLAGRCWLYQCCTEFAWWQTSDYPVQPFGHYAPLEYWLNRCPDVFGEEISIASNYKAVAATNRYFGAKKHYKGTNVVLINGSQDPWHPLGIYEMTPNPGATVVFMKGAAHCADMYPEDDKRDLESIKHARSIINRKLEEWLN